MIVFTKTKAATLEVAAALEAGGFKAEALNGDMAQNAREQAVNRLKKDISISLRPQMWQPGAWMWTGFPMW